VFSEHRPIAYQYLGGRRVPVSARVELLGARNRRTETDSYGFRLGEYDASRPVVIDPVVFGYAGFLGGSGDDQSFDVAADRAGNAYVAGSTDSPDFPATPGPFSAPRGSTDAFVAKVDPAGRLVYADYIGGTGFQDTARGVAVDQYGDAYITGPTDSPQSSFPVTVGPDLTYNGNEDAFVAKLDPTGTNLLYAGYIGGECGEGGRDIAVDPNGYAYVAGTTAPCSLDPTDSTFPATVGPQLHYGGGAHDGFVAKVKQDGSGLVYCSYIGGTGDEDNVRGVAPDAAGNLYITGHVGGPPGSDSSEGFPVTVGPDLTYHGGMDGYVGKINSSGTAFDYLGYVGGSGFEQPRRIAIDAAGDAYVAGATQSRDFPVKVGPDRIFHGGTSDAFVTEVNPSGTGLVYSGFIGGDGRDEAYGLAVDSAGSAYVAGSTTSAQDTFPVSGGPDLTYNGNQDGFIAKVKPGGTGLDYAGYIGGSGSDIANGLALDGAGRAYVAGATSSSGGSFPTHGSMDSSYNGGPEDAFLAQVEQIPTISSLTPTSGVTGTNITITGANLRGATGVSFGRLAARFTVLSDTQVRAEVPDGAVAGAVSVTSPTDTATSSQDFTPTLSITQVSPSSGPVGTAVTISGIGFAPGSVVKFDGTPAATVRYVSSGEVDATVPADATSGPVTLSTAVRTVRARSSYTVTAHIAPTVASFTPISGITGSLVTITGTSVSGAGRVTFGGVPAPEFTVVSPTTLRVNVANGAVAGPISVTTAAGTGTSSQSFTPSLSINGYTPTRGPAGTVVDIDGIGFTQTAIVKFNGTRAHPVTFVSPREVRTTVSAGTTTGPITITTAAGTVRGIGKYQVATTTVGSHRLSIALAITRPFAM
jgi:hypothetical protein